MGAVKREWETSFENKQDALDDQMIAYWYAHGKPPTTLEFMAWLPLSFTSRKHLTPEQRREWFMREFLPLYNLHYHRLFHERCTAAPERRFQSAVAAILQLQDPSVLDRCATYCDEILLQKTSTV